MLNSKSGSGTALGMTEETKDFGSGQLGEQSFHIAPGGAKEEEVANQELYMAQVRLRKELGFKNDTQALKKDINK